METEKLEIGKNYDIHAYKHDGSIHRAWDEAILLEIHDDYLIGSDTGGQANPEHLAQFFHILEFSKQKKRNILLL